ncbi:glycosyltransferase family 2 protein [Candidatus Formimonas warabiya]|uniref:Glucosyl-3-phosphoglycerate synthase n=1 Tax=Formimonas warabiya TaxID=1761012 RepID=A0A3G1KPZ6_FORW1|nr:glycosyltransferase family 2 protein [Candidatus Formimonas warabiya]ATW24531.1 glycosyl transferase family 2 [Candidatus Formimonas warabiya]
MAPVTAIIPAYNEEATIGEIISVLCQVDDIAEIIVVSDGSVDATAEVARRAGARVIELPDNMGKGGAMKVGVDHSRTGIILFLDADLIGLTCEHVNSLIFPVIHGEVKMTVGIFEKGRLATDLAQFVAPYLSGQRALEKDLLDEICDLEECRFGVEVALTKYAHDNNIAIKEVELSGMSHIMKEEKMGLARGLAARMKMYWEIAKTVGSGLKR